MYVYGISDQICSKASQASKDNILPLHLNDRKEIERIVDCIKKHMRHTVPYIKLNLVVNYNQLTYTKNCIDSLLKSDFQDFHIALIDNGLKKKFQNNLLKSIK